MGRSPCCDKTKVKKGPWSPEEDQTLKNFLQKNGAAGNWISLPHKAGLKRCGKSCRLRWLNYLRPDIKHGAFTEEEDLIICTLYSKIGSRWSIIASKLPGRTDNDVKNHWNTKLKKKLAAANNNSKFDNDDDDNNNNANANKPLSDSSTNLPENLDLSTSSASPNLPFLTDHQITTGMTMFNTKNTVYDPNIYFTWPRSSTTNMATYNLLNFSPISQESSSMSGGSSSLAMEDNKNYMASWSGINGGGLDQIGGFPSFDVSHGYPHQHDELMGGMWSQEYAEVEDLPSTNPFANLGSSYY